MLGGTELEQLGLQKQALVAESTLNRHALVAEIGALRAARTRLSSAITAPGRFVPLLMALAPIVGFFTVRGLGRPVSFITRITKLVKWVGPAVSLWRTLSAARQRQAEGH
jgi:hypothetical protein